MYIIQGHPQWEERSREYERKQGLLKRMQKNYERYNAAINERIREHQREIIALQRDLRDYVNDYNADCAILREVPKFKEFRIKHLKNEPTRNQKEKEDNPADAMDNAMEVDDDDAIPVISAVSVMSGEEQKEEEKDCAAYSCPICLNDFDKTKIIYVDCSGIHYTCYDCMIMLTKSQDEPKCPLCRDTIHSMGCLDREICAQLADRFMI